MKGSRQDQPRANVCGMSEAEQPLREQMTDAIASIRKQLELLRAGPSLGGPFDDRSVIPELEAELQALNAARANLD